MVRFWVGVSGFSYASWKGVFYAEGTRPEQMLEAYSNKLSSVEINSSFYHTPTQSVTTKWANSTKRDFRFSFKANRQITHIKKLRNASADMANFCNNITPTGDRLGCVLVQLPPFLKQDFDTLEGFLKEKPESIRVAMEFRHSSWFGTKLNEMLTKYGAVLCIAETEDMAPVFEKTTDFVYVRLRKEHYSKKELKDWCEKLLKFAGDSNDCFVYFKHDETGAAANTAVEFSQMLVA